MGKLTTHVLDTVSGNPAQGVRIRLHRDGELLAETVTNGWMVALGMEISHAPDGTVRGILAGSHPDAAPLLLGSHLDTVIDAGKYDGVLGIIAALAALETLHQEKITLPFPVHLLAFSYEEGTRFQTTYLGSRSIVAPLDPATLKAKDAAGITIDLRHPRLQRHPARLPRRPPHRGQTTQHHPRQQSRRRAAADVNDLRIAQAHEVPMR